METVVVALIVGAFGGLLGSIAGPWLTHRLSRRQREEQREEQRHSVLRDMIEEIMAEARLNMGANFMLYADVRTGSTPQKAFEHYLKRLAERVGKTPRRHIWRPHRIDDGELRALTEKLEERDDMLMEFNDTITGISPQEIGDWMERCSPIAGELEDLLKKVDLRLDDLGW